MKRGANHQLAAIGVIPESTAECLRIDVVYCGYNRLDGAARRAGACGAWQPGGLVQTLPLAPCMLDEDSRLFREALLGLHPSTH